MKKKIVILLTATVLPMYGCKEPMVKSHSYGQNSSIELIFPNPENSHDIPNTTVSATKLLYLPEYSHQDERSTCTYENALFSRTLKWNKSNEGFSVEGRDCALSPSHPGCNEFFQVNSSLSGDWIIENQSDKYILTINSLKHTRSVTDNSLVGCPQDLYFNYSYRELKKDLSGPIFSWKYEVNSPYSSESTYANFARLLEKSEYKEGHRDTVTGKIFKEKFIVNIDQNDIEINVETYPYRDGSKVVIYSKIPPIVNGTTYDFVSITKKLKIKLNEIVGS